MLGSAAPLRAAQTGRIERTEAVPAPVAIPDRGPAAQSGRIAYYGSKFHGRTTASGERFDANGMTMAHRTLPFGTMVKVTNPANGRSVVVRVNDRGPAQGNLVGDVSLAAAKKLGFVQQGVIDAQLEVVGSKRVAER
jgi:rare lipoprotein A